MNFFQLSWQFVASIIVGLIVIGIVALKPKFFWPILIFVVVGTAGLMVNGYCLIDEYLTACVLLGSLLSVSIGFIHFRRKQENVWDQFHKWMFFLLIIYMIAQSIRGLFLWEDWRIIRWIIYYSMLGILSFIITKKGFFIPDAKKTLSIILTSGILYFGLYMIYGLFYEKVKGLSRFTTQGLEWSGSAYATFPLIVVIPGALFLLKSNVRIHQWLGWVGLIIAAIVGFYYNSRISLLILSVFLILSLPILGFRKLILPIVIFLIIPSLIFYPGNKGKFIEEIGKYGKALCESAQALWSPRHSDLDRNLHLRASFLAVGADCSTLLLGYGMHSERFVLRPYVQRLYNQYLPRAKVPPIVRTTGFTAFLVNTGLIGIFLLCANFLIVGCRIFVHQKGFSKVVLLISLLITFLWLFISNIQDIVLLYLIIMPSGLLVQLSQHGVAEQPVKEAN